MHHQQAKCKVKKLLATDKQTEFYILKSYIKVSLVGGRRRGNSPRFTSKTFLSTLAGLVPCLKRSLVATLLDLTGIVEGGEDLNDVAALGNVDDLANFLSPDMLRVSLVIL